LKVTGNPWNRRRGIDPGFLDFDCSRAAGDDLLAGTPVHPVTIAIALRAGQTDGQMQAAGKRIALADLLIGSTALELGYSVATANVRHFATIPDLSIERL